MEISDCAVVAQSRTCHVPG